MDVRFAQPFAIIAAGGSTYSITIVGDDFFAAHGGAGTCPGDCIVVVAANKRLVALGAAAGSKQVVDFALVEFVIPSGNSVVKPRRNVDGNFGIGQIGFNGGDNFIEISATQCGIGNASTALIVLGIQGIAGDRIL